MDGYQEFWNNLIFGSDNIFFPSSWERYWMGTAVFVGFCLMVGIASFRLRPLAPAVTGLILGAYVAAVVPFMVWSAQCSGCGAAYSYDSPRSRELYQLHTVWGGFFAMGIAAIWLGVLISQGAKSVIDWQRSH